MSITTYSEFEDNFLVRNGMQSNDINLNKAPRQLKTELDELNLSKQDILVSGTNIKTINGTSVLGSGDIVTTQTSITGNAGTASKLETARTINGVSFDGSADINITDSSKQDILVSGTNIKTINGTSVLGSGDIAFPTYLPPTDLGADKFLSGDGTYKIIDTNITWDKVTDKPVNTVLTESFTATAGQTTFLLNYSPNSLSVFKNGLKLKENIQFTATNGTSITFNPALSAGDYIDITGMVDTATIVVYNKTEVDTLVGDLTLLLDAINGESI